MLPSVLRFSSRGYVGLSVVVFLIMLSALVFPFIFPGKQGGVGCVVGKVPESYEKISGIPAIKDLDVDAHESSGIEQGGPDPEQTSEFVLIRKDVPTFKRVWSVATNKENLDYEFLGSSEFTHHSHTVNVGELPQKAGYDAYYPAKWGEIDLPDKKTVYIRNEGLLFFAKKDPASIKQTKNNTIYLTDVYQDISKYGGDTEAYKGKGEQYFKCLTDSGAGTGNEVQVPTQAVSEKRDQLQMEWFKFGEGGAWGIHCKPAVYLYPREKQLVNVRVYPKGELSYTDPVYDPVSGWTVEAYPDGKLEPINDLRLKIYDYLYYESKIFDREIEKPTKGWVVRGGSSILGQESSEMKKLFDKVLPELGLNAREKKDFMDYWLSKLPESSYYFVGLIDKNQRDYLEALEVNPMPETSIRFSLYFEALDLPRIVQEPVIKTPVRNGFTLVDWGGMIKLHPGTEFTCSQ